MQCPLCLDTVLDETFHLGIEIDICPRCKGMWLDRGELDRLLGDERRDPRRQPDRRDHRDDRGRDIRDDRDDRGRRDEWDDEPRSGSKKSKKKSKAKRLADLFEEVLDL